MEIRSQYLPSVRFLRQTTGTSIINKFLNSLLCLRQAPGLIHPQDYLHRPSMIVITGTFRKLTALSEEKRANCIFELEKV
jgi:hypothetical protein